MLPLGEETAVQAVVDSIVWAFRRLKKQKAPAATRFIVFAPNFLSFFVTYIMRRNAQSNAAALTSAIQETPFHIRPALKPQLVSPSASEIIHNPVKLP